MFTAGHASVTTFAYYEQAAIRNTLYSSNFSLDSSAVLQEFQICLVAKTGRNSPVFFGEILKWG